ncbi:MAG: proline iminopeptidase-family hydrolase [Candidatus Binatus sp.]|uniref:proline iminopeptidase-family hydrolase n=1 Tax=Candidatus Binatus sp. TaxID=2811406 RepID=UPI00271D38CF|nr:proline iminopeptidase-family hydrolase [Candidatus Binatus sp.]MDO8434971.1 proline iminopeptidase-family hydrolase [Candidatus Binatus sp.]
MNRSRRAFIGAVAIAVVVVVLKEVATSRAEEKGDPYALPKDCAVREGFVAVTGGRVWYQRVGSGDATPLLTLHGGPGFGHDYLQPLGRLCAERPVIFYDQLGSGKSDRPKDDNLWRVARFVEELGQVRAALGLKRVHILGQSWGTMLLTSYMLTKPDGVASVIFSDPAISMPQWVKDARRLRSELPAETQATLDRHEKLGSTNCYEYQAAVNEYYKRHVCRLAVYPEVLERAFAGLGQNVYLTMNGPTEFSVTGNLKDYDRVARLKEIAHPAMFICGRFDEGTPEATESYHRAMPGSEFVVMEKSSHMPMLEEPDRYIEVVREFIGKNDHAQ